MLGHHPQLCALTELQHIMAPLSHISARYQSIESFIIVIKGRRHTKAIAILRKDVGSVK